MEKPKITVMKNGPLRLNGEVEIVDPEGKVYNLQGRTILSLCRCGLSTDKPFCDGSHKHHGFLHDPEAFDLPPKKI